MSVSAPESPSMPTVGLAPLACCRHTHQASQGGCHSRPAAGHHNAAQRSTVRNTAWKQQTASRLSPGCRWKAGCPVGGLGPTLAWSAVMVRMTLTPQFCARVRGMTSMACATALYGHCMPHPPSTGAHAGGSRAGVDVEEGTPSSRNGVPSSKHSNKSTVFGTPSSYKKLCFA